MRGHSHHRFTLASRVQTISAASGASVARRYRGLKVALFQTQGAVPAAETPATVTVSWSPPLPSPFDLISVYDD